MRESERERKKKFQLPTHSLTTTPQSVSRRSGWRPVLFSPPALRRLLTDPDPLGDLHYSPSGLGSYIYLRCPLAGVARLDMSRRTGREGINISTPEYSTAYSIQYLAIRSGTTGGLEEKVWMHNPGPCGRNVVPPHAPWIGAHAKSLQMILTSW